MVGSGVMTFAVQLLRVNALETLAAALCLRRELDGKYPF
jgi:hypothetical protein